MYIKYEICPSQKGKSNLFQYKRLMAFDLHISGSALKKKKQKNPKIKTLQIAGIYTNKQEVKPIP